MPMIFVASICLLNLYSCWEGDERVCVFKTGHFASLRQTGEVKKLTEATEGCVEKVGVGGEGRSCCAMHWTVRLSLLFHITIFQSSISPPFRCQESTSCARVPKESWSSFWYAFKAD